MEREEREEETNTPGNLLALRRFNALDGEWTSEELGRFFWLTPKDMLQVKTCRGATNRLGFALNGLLGRIDPRLVHLVGQPYVHH